MASETGKIAEVLFEKSLETYEHQQQMLDLVSFMGHDPEKMQTSNNVFWTPVQQHAPIIDGWDLTDEETGIIEETYPSILGTPKNDFVEQRADELRTMRFWERRGEQSGLKQATDLNKRIADAIRLQGSLFYRSNADSGYEFIAEAQAMMNERQLFKTQRYFMLNDRDNLLFGTDLAARQTLQGRPETVWATGQIGQNIADFDVYTGSFMSNLTSLSGTIVAAVDGDQSFAPEGGSVVEATGVVTNVDYRTATILVDLTVGIAVGTKITISNSAVPVQAISLADKTETGEAMTFTVVSLVTDTSITVYPKPIALDDAALSTIEAAYANINTQILDAATIAKVNTDVTAQTNLYWDKSAIEVIGGTIPAQLFKQFAGMKVITDTLSNGLDMYMVYDGNIATMNFRYRIFTWSGITVANPSNCGVAVTY